jgi:hypothetical protein
MSDPLPLPYGRDAHGRFTAGNCVAKGRAHAFAKQAAALRRAFYQEVKPQDMRRVVRRLITEAAEGNLQAARLLLLWVLGKPDDPVHPDGPAARKLRSDVILPFKRQKRLILAVIDVFPSRFLPSGTPESADVTPFPTSR